MINANTLPVDIEEMRLWAEGYKEQFDLSWVDFGKACSIPPGTLQPWVKGNYNGDNAKLARQMFRFRQTIQAKSEREVGLLVDPGYFPTPTSQRLHALAVMAQTGRICVAGTGPGTGKTMMMREYAAQAEPVWQATMKKSTRKLVAALQVVQASLGLKVRPTYMYPSALSREIADYVKGRNGLLIVDEANHLDVDAIEELRAIHDETGVGLLLLGNEELISMITSGRKRDQFARLNSRIAYRHVQPVPLQGDVDAFCEAWGVTDPGMQKLLARIGLTPGTGGLRECRQVLQLASFIAADAGRAVTLADLKDAQADRTTQFLNAA